MLCYVCQVSALQILKTDGEAEQGLTHRPAHHLDGYRYFEQVDEAFTSIAIAF